MDDKKSKLQTYLPEIIFYLAAVVLLFLNLNIRGITGSEGRWCEVVREMFLSGDFLHPTINGIPYFDKPLVSYWVIAFFSFFNGGAVNLFLVRLPSALAALGVLWGTRIIAEETVGKEYVRTAGWIMLTVYSFAFWGRHGEADMLNLAFSTLAVAWYLKRRDHSDFLSYLLFGVLCAVGGQTKGLSSIAVPVIAVLTDTLLNRRWKQHLNWKLLFAGIFSLAVYLLPFVLAMLQSKNYSANGLELVFRENILRYFKAFDHQEPWYAYCIHLPQLLLPWTPFLILAFLQAVKDWPKNIQGKRFLLLFISVIFIIFSLSDSKRVYYILPILPCCAVLTAEFLLAKGTRALYRLRDLLLRLYSWALLFFACLMLLTVPVWYFAVSKNLKNQLPADLINTVLLCLIPAALIVIACFIAARKKALPLAGCIASFLIILITVFGVILPVIDQSVRTTQPFFRKASSTLQKHGIPSAQVYYYRYNYVDPTYYLAFSHPIQLLDSEFIFSERSDNEIRTLFTKEKHGFAVLMQRRHVNKINSPALRKYILDHVICEESFPPWEHRGRLKHKYILTAPDKDHPFTEVK